MAGAYPRLTAPECLKGWLGSNQQTIVLVTSTIRLPFPLTSLSPALIFSGRHNSLFCFSNTLHGLSLSTPRILRQGNKRGLLLLLDIPGSVGDVSTPKTRLKAT